LTRSEVDEMVEDISDAFLELGTLEDEPNLIYKRRLWKNPDRTYLAEEDYDPVFRDYEMHGISLGLLDRKEAEEIGFSDDLIFKYYITGDQFFQYNADNDIFEPRSYDRILHRGTIYEIVRKKQILISETAVIYLIFAKEGAITLQSEAVRDKAVPNFEFDADREITSETDTTKRNMFMNLPAEVKGYHAFPTTVWNIENKFTYSINNGEPITVALEPKSYTVEEFLEDFRPEGLRVEMDNDIVILKTVELGKRTRLDILFDENNMYELLGITAGTYFGRDEIRI
jgi:hypothetical protein